MTCLYIKSRNSAELGVGQTVFFRTANIQELLLHFKSTIKWICGVHTICMEIICIIEHCEKRVERSVGEETNWWIYWHWACGVIHSSNILELKLGKIDVGNTGNLNGDIVRPMKNVPRTDVYCAHSFYKICRGMLERIAHVLIDRFFVILLNKFWVTEIHFKLTLSDSTIYKQIIYYWYEYFWMWFSSNSSRSRYLFWVHSHIGLVWYTFAFAVFL